ncbi:hypothetical protein EI546_08960 [Aequorivita sp. H23M31]|uniref:Uncharacterized protein n=1 Tax=Aequorivita ciconiae TaxID=2494375 RepID=A0A410G3M4_9FLAO|nr:hypothetical protein [Aequorivita sp. H23M31]QAA81839.1 hypothetical protein EI546_08960 [Aequorivita sp. H23M31]
MALKSGTKGTSSAVYPGSMSDAMAQAFREEWPTVMGDAPVPASNEQMNLIFRAVSQGVIRHLKQNCSSMRVAITVTIGGSTYNGTGTVNDIDIT